MTNRQSNTSPPGIARERIFRIVTAYAVFGALWILLSDMALEKLLPDPHLIAIVSALKGWLFVAITAGLLYWVLKRLTAAPPDSPPASLPRPYLTGALLVVSIGVSTAAAAYLMLQNYEEEEVIRLQAIADLRAHQVADRLLSLRHNADHIFGENPLVDLFRRWRNGDTASGKTLQGHLEQYVQKTGFDALSLLDAQEEPLWRSGRNETEPALHLLPALRQAATQHQVIRAVPTRHSAHDPAHLNYVVPLLYQGVLQGYVVLHADMQEWFDNALQSWPELTNIGDVVLFRHVGTDVIFLNALRFMPDAAMRLRAPLDDREQLAAKALRGEADDNGKISGRDHANERAIGVMRQIPGTDWFLLAEVRLAEVISIAAKGIVWTILTGFMLLVLAFAGLSSARQRRRLEIAEATRQSQAEKLRALQLLEAIADGSTDSIFARDLQGRFLLINRAAANAIGKSAEQTLGRQLDEILPPEDALPMDESDRQVIRDGRPRTEDFRIDTIAGRRDYLVTKAPLRDEHGEIFGVFGIGRDITETKQAERRLIEREARYRAVIETSGDGFWMVDGQGLIRESNEAYARMSGYSRQELLDIPITNLDSDQSPEEVRSHIERIMHEGSGFFESRHRAKDGRIWPVEVAVSYSSEAGGYFFAFLRDITQRKAAEAALRQSEQDYRQLFESSQDALLTLAPPDWHFTSANPAVLRMFGFDSLEEFTALGPAGHSPPRQPDGRLSSDSVREKIALVLREGSAYFEWMHRRRDGELFPTDVLVTRIERAGATMLMSTVRDISARKQAEQELRARNEELERFNRATVNRELAMIELKKQINALSGELGRDPAYRLDFLSTVEERSGSV